MGENIGSALLLSVTFLIPHLHGVYVCSGMSMLWGAVILTDSQELSLHTIYTQPFLIHTPSFMKAFNVAVA